MRKIVVNSTPLIALNNIGKLDLLKKVYGKIVIPPAVYEEVILDVNTKKPKDFIKERGFITISNINNEEAKELFSTSLHKGEVEVMILAHEINADLCVIDDLLARKYAKYHNLKTTGTIGVLLKSKQLGIVDNVKPILDELISASMYIDTKLYNKTLKIAEEDN